MLKQSLFFRNNWRKPEHYVHAQPFFYEDYPAYDLDEEDQRSVRNNIQSDLRTCSSELN